MVVKASTLTRWLFLLVLLCIGKPASSEVVEIYTKYSSEEIGYGWLYKKISVCEVVFPHHVHRDTGGFVSIVVRQQKYDLVYVDGREDIDIVRYRVSGLSPQQCREWRLPPVTVYSPIEHSVLLRGPNINGGPITLEVDSVEDEILYVRDPLLSETTSGISGAIAYIRHKSIASDTLSINVPIGIALGPLTDSQQRRTGLFKILLFRFAAGDLRLSLRVLQTSNQSENSNNSPNPLEQVQPGAAAGLNNRATVETTGAVIPAYLTNCDLKAANPADPGRHPSVMRTYLWHDLDYDAAISACNQDIGNERRFGRLLYQLGRAYAKKFEETKDALWAGKAFTELSNALDLGHNYSLVNIYNLLFSSSKNGLCDQDQIGECDRLYWSILSNAESIDVAYSNLRKGLAFLNLDPVALDCATRDACDLAAVEYFRAAMAAGNAEAMAQLAWMYSETRGVADCQGEECLRRSVLLNKKASELGIIWATRNLAHLYKKQHGVSDCNSQQTCDVKAVELYKSAAEKGDVDAVGNLASMYSDQRGVSDCQGVECIHRSMELYEKARDLGVAWAIRQLGNKYRLRQGVADCSDQSSCDLIAVNLYREAIDLGDADAIGLLGWMYSEERGVTDCQDDDCWLQAAELYKKASDRGVVWAIRNLGHLYKNQQGVTDCFDRQSCDLKAVELYQQAADKGNANAIGQLAWMISNERGVTDCDGQECVHRAAELYHKASDLGVVWATRNLAHLYKNHRDLAGCTDQKSCDTKAVKLYRKAANDGDAYAKGNLAWMYFKNRGVNDCEGEACWFRSVELYKEASDLGVVWATTNLANRYKNRQGVTDCLDQTDCDVRAVALYQKAAERGDADAIAHLAWMYIENRGGTDCDGQECWFRAAELYKEASDLGVVWATRNLGNRYRYREGVTDCANADDCDSRAVELYQEAADEGDDEALILLGQMYARMRVKADCSNSKCWQIAADLFHKAKSTKSAWAYFELGRLYQRVARFHDWTSDTLAQGSITCNSLNSCLEDAVKHYQKSADLGYANAFVELGSIYEYSEIDDLCMGHACLKTALQNYEKALELGSTVASEHIAQLYLRDRSLMRCPDEHKCDQIIIGKLQEEISLGRDYMRVDLADLYFRMHIDKNRSQNKNTLCEESNGDCFILALNTLLDGNSSYVLDHGFYLIDDYYNHSQITRSEQQITRYRFAFFFRYLYGSFKESRDFETVNLKELMGVDREDAKEMQRLLASAEDYQGPIDGKFGPMSQSALKAYVLRECAKDTRDCGLLSE